MISCLVADCSPLEDQQAYGRAYSLLSGARRLKADSFAFQKDRALSAAAGLFIRLVEASFGEVSIDGNGKPHAPGIEFNLSHSGRYVAFAASDLPVGVDIEGIGHNMDIASSVMTPEEYSDFSEISDEGLFASIWTSKESYMKATGLGFRLAPDSFRVLYGRELRCPDPGMTMSQLPAPEGYRLSVCSADKGCDVRRIGIDELMDARTLDDIAERSVGNPEHEMEK